MFDILVDKVRSNYSAKDKVCVSFLNPYSYYIGRKNRELYCNLDDIYIDGQLMVRLLRLLGFKDLKRYSFDATSLAPIVFKDSVDNHKSVYIIGAKPDEVPLAVESIEKEYCGINIIDFQSGYFKSAEHRDETIENIIELNPEVVLVGMGAVHQERFLIDLKSRGWTGAGYTCGGFLHQVTTGLEYYPQWIDRLNIRWAYRIYDEPKLFKRYFIEYPIAIVYILTDFIKFKFFNKKSNVA